jgi:DNA adenine methylase
MGYFGGKDRYGAEIAQVVKSYCKQGQMIYEPFCGGINVTQHFNPREVIASDISKPLILCLQAMQEGWSPPDCVAELEYDQLKKQWQSGIDNALIGFVGYGCSWGAKWFGGYARDPNRNYCREAKNSLLHRVSLCKNVTFQHRHYRNVLPKDSVIYCDPPYRDTTDYSFGDWCHNTFWHTVRKWSKTNKVIVSEYTAPSDFKIVAEFNHFAKTGTSDSKETVERLWVLK